MSLAFQRTKRNRDGTELENGIEERQTMTRTDEYDGVETQIVAWPHQQNLGQLKTTAIKHRIVRHIINRLQKNCNSKETVEKKGI